MVANRGWGWDGKVPCPVCAGRGSWHSGDGTTCQHEVCVRKVTECLFCSGSRRVSQTW